MHKHIITATILTFVLVPVVASASTVTYENGTITVSALEAGNQIIFFDNNGDYDTSFTSDGSFEPNPELYTSPFRYIEVNTTDDPYSISCGTYDECLASPYFISIGQTLAYGTVSYSTMSGAGVVALASTGASGLGSGMLSILGLVTAIMVGLIVYKYGKQKMKNGIEIGYNRNVKNYGKGYADYKLNKDLGI